MSLVLITYVAAFWILAVVFYLRLAIGLFAKLMAKGKSKPIAFVAASIVIICALAGSFWEMPKQIAFPFGNVAFACLFPPVYYWYRIYRNRSINHRVLKLVLLTPLTFYCIWMAVVLVYGFAYVLYSNFVS